MKKQYKERIANGKLEDVIDELIELTSSKNEYRELNNILILKKIHFCDNEENYHLKGIIPPNEYRINRNQIANALLIIVDRINQGKEFGVNQKTDILKQDKDNYVLLFGRSSVGKTAFISSIARKAEGVSSDFELKSLETTTGLFKYFPKEGEHGFMEVSFAISDSRGEREIVNIIEMTDYDLKETLLFKESEKDKLSQKNISQLYILMSDIESGDKDDFVIAMFIKLLCENLKNLSFILIINKWDLLEEGRKHYWRDWKTAEEYVNGMMPLTSKLLKSNEIIDNSIMSYTAKDYHKGNYLRIDSILEKIKMKLAIIE
ncbi:MAG: hypothetical protein R2828_25660 [Saprospiraceae bacterium]